nr:hypothetical protein [Tanacetum cinerariifolium]
MAISDVSGSNVVDSINNLDADNPLHVQNSDNSSSVLIPFKLQGTENYRIWGSMKLALQARNKFVFVDGTCLKPAYATSNVLFAQWDRCNDMSYKKPMIRLMVLLCIIFYKKINTVKQGGSSVTDCYHILNSLWRECDALTKVPKCTYEVQYTCDASKELSLHQHIMKLMQLLMGLDDCYQPVRSALLTTD